MGFWYPDLNVGYYSPLPYHKKQDLIFYFEALCILSALFDAHSRMHAEGGGCFIIYTDNFNTIEIFNTLCALPVYNHLLKAAIDILYYGDHDMRVLHVPDALSGADFYRALALSPKLKVSTFKPWSWTPSNNRSLSF
jgi:hypothetical protein